MGPIDDDDSWAEIESNRHMVASYLINESISLNFSEFTTGPPITTNSGFNLNDPIQTTGSSTATTTSAVVEQQAVNNVQNNSLLFSFASAPGANAGFNLNSNLIHTNDESSASNLHTTSVLLNNAAASAATAINNTLGNSHGINHHHPIGGGLTDGHHAINVLNSASSTAFGQTTTPRPYMGDALQSFQTVYWPIHCVICLVICTLGIFANVTNIIVLSRPNMITAVNTILSAIAFSDLLVNISTIPYLIHELSDSTNLTSFYSYQWAVYTLFHAHSSVTAHTISIWLTCVLATWRYFVVCRSQSSNQRNWSVGLAKRTIVAVFLFVPCFCIPNYLSFAIIKDVTDTNITMFRVGFSSLADESHFIKTFHFWIFSCATKLLPCVLLTFFTTVLIRKLLHARERRLRLTSYGNAKQLTHDECGTGSTNLLNGGPNSFEKTTKVTKAISIGGIGRKLASSNNLLGTNATAAGTTVTTVTTNINNKTNSKNGNTNKSDTNYKSTNASHLPDLNTGRPLMNGLASQGNGNGRPESLLVFNELVEKSSACRASMAEVGTGKCNDVDATTKSADESSNDYQKHSIVLTMANSGDISSAENLNDHHHYRHHNGHDQHHHQHQHNNHTYYHQHHDQKFTNTDRKDRAHHQQQQSQLQLQKRLNQSGSSCVITEAELLNGAASGTSSSSNDDMEPGSESNNTNSNHHDDDNDNNDCENVIRLTEQKPRILSQLIVESTTSSINNTTTISTSTAPTKMLASCDSKPVKTGGASNANGGQAHESAQLKLLSPRHHGQQQQRQQTSLSLDQASRSASTCGALESFCSGPTGFSAECCSCTANNINQPANRQSSQHARDNQLNNCCCCCCSSKNLDSSAGHKQQLIAGKPLILSDMTASQELPIKSNSNIGIRNQLKPLDRKSFAASVGANCENITTLANSASASAAGTGAGATREIFSNNSNCVHRSMFMEFNEKRSSSQEAGTGTGTASAASRGRSVGSTTLIPIQIKLQATQKQLSQNETTTRLLIAVMIVFLICEFPAGILAALCAIYGQDFWENVYPPCGIVTDLLALINSSVNFVLYCFMSTQFRITFYRVVLHCPAPK